MNNKTSVDIKQIKSQLDALTPENMTQENILKIVQPLSGAIIREEINNYQKNLEFIKNAKVSTNAELKGYRRNYDEILHELSEMGVDSKSIPKTIHNLYSDIIKNLLEIDENMPDIEELKSIIETNSDNSKLNF